MLPMLNVQPSEVCVIKDDPFSSVTNVEIESDNCFIVDSATVTRAVFDDAASFALAASVCAFSAVSFASVTSCLTLDVISFDLISIAESVSSFV